MESRKKERIAAACAAISAHQTASGNTETDSGEAATDLLTDLRHWLHEEGDDIKRVLALSRMHFQAELVELDTPHQRWCIRETWLVHHSLIQDESSRRYWTEQAARQLRGAAKQPQLFPEPLSDWQTARYYLAAQLQREVEDGAAVEQGSVNAALLRSSLSNVDWFEISESLLDTLQAAK